MNTYMCGCCYGHPQRGNCLSNLGAFGHYNTLDFGRDPRQKVSEAAGLAPWDHTWSPPRRMEVAHVPGPQQQHGSPSVWIIGFHFHVVCEMSAHPTPGSVNAKPFSWSQELFLHLFNKGIYPRLGVSGHNHAIKFSLHGVQLNSTGVPLADRYFPCFSAKGPSPFSLLQKMHWASGATRVGFQEAAQGFPFDAIWDGGRQQQVHPAEELAQPHSWILPSPRHSPHCPRVPGLHRRGTQVA